MKIFEVRSISEKVKVLENNSTEIGLSFRRKQFKYALNDFPLGVVFLGS
jgi:hypothetical protein